MVTLAELRKLHQDKIANTQQNDDKKQSSDFVSFDLGEHDIRILPGKEDALDFFVENTIHKYKDAEGKWQTFHCRRPHNEKCPVCDYYFDLWKRHKALSLAPKTKSKFGNLATMIKQKSRYTIRAVIRALQKKGEDPVKFFTMDKKTFERVLSGVTNPDFCDEDDPDNTTVISLERGNDFKVKAEKKGEYTVFDNSEFRIKKSRAGTPQECDAWLNHKLDLKSIIKEESYEDGKKIVDYLETTLNNVKTENAPTSQDAPFDVDDDGEQQFQKGLKS